LWDGTYLHDGFSGQGFPLSEEISDVEDFRVSWKSGPGEEESVQIVLDLGKVQKISRVQLWPAEAPHGMAIPLFGFPGKVTVELSTHPDFSESNVMAKKDMSQQLNQDILLNILTGPQKIRYIRLTLADLAHYKGETILGLGEVLVSGLDAPKSLGCAVTGSGIPPAGLDQLPRLVDGFSRKRRILREVEWIKGLAQRRPLDRRLAVVEQELEGARNDWGALKLRSSIWGGGLIGFGLLSAMGLQRLQRRKVLKKLKTRITRDLHDEVGSGLGGIALKSGVLEGMVADEGVRMELSDVTLMARETSASLREVVWMLDQASIRLPALIEKMVERAERVLHGLQLSIEQSPELPDAEVALSCKRHLIMFFKEAVHNCARHAKATQVTVSVLIVDTRFLRISVRDDGCGFDPSEEQGGCGVGNMKKRAEELHGELELRSAPGEGTLVQLTLPLDALRREPTKTYKTSN
jgi:signal transduction histidine kinase